MTTNNHCNKDDENGVSWIRERRSQQGGKVRNSGTEWPGVKTLVYFITEENTLTTF